MENFDFEGFVIKDDFYNSIKDEIICSICEGIKYNPLMCTKCQNSFCSKCIEIWKLKSDICPFKCKSPEYTFCRIVNNLLSKLNFNCKNKCDEIIPFDKLQNHYEFECKKIDLREKNKVLMEKYNQIVQKYDKLKNSFASLLNFSLESKIVEDPDHLIFLKNTFLQYYDEKKISFTLLYRASKHGDTAQSFHSHCDNKKGGILIIFQTDANVIFGGFSDAVWFSYFNPEKKINGKSLNGEINFLFQLNKEKIYNLREVDNSEKVGAIYCRIDCGPCFGFLGEDIWIH